MSKFSREGAPSRSAGEGRDKPWKKAGRGGPRRPAAAAPWQDGTGEERVARDGSVWLHGTHAVLAALANPARRVLEVRATRNASADLPQGVAFELIEGEALSALLAPGAVHQGLAARVLPLPDPGLAGALAASSGLMLVLDQVTDPHNVGAVFRSAAAFGASAIISQDRKAAPQSGAMAKAAAGGIETVADVRVVNIAQAIRSAQEEGWRAVGLAGEAEADLDAVLDGRPTLLVLGAEGRGLRHLVGETCDALARIPIGAAMESLNVSVAAGIALSAAARAREGAKARETAEAFLRAMEARDFAAARALTAPGFVATFPGGERFTDPADIPAWTAARVEHVRKRVTATRVTPGAAGPEVLTTGVLSGAWLDGESFSGVRFADLFACAGGRVAALTVWNDLAEAASARV